MNKNLLKEAESYNALNILTASDYKKLKKILDDYKNWSRAWDKFKNENHKIDAEKEWQKLDSLGIKMILKEDSSYPNLLKEINWPPFAIYLKGNIPLKNTIAVVGTRKATTLGKNLANDLAQKLSLNDITVVSGLALGIDEAAHSGVIKAGGQTIAVLPTGLDKIYPSQNDNLAKKILDFNGALISEYPLCTPSYPANFIQRNRIISGLSIATVIIEAPEKSGALATARFALEQNREIFVVPGPANHQNYKGSHGLIRAGARLATSVEEILEDLNIDFKTADEKAVGADISDEEKMILEAIKEIGWPASIDKLYQKTNIDIQKINRIITFLTIKGIIK